MPPYRIGYCITAHGLGHAARSMAIMEALAGLADIHFTIVGVIPEWFFESPAHVSCTCHRLPTDVGLVQHTPLHEDVSATIRELKDFYPLRQQYVDHLAGLFSGCDLVLCDIAPAGIAAARTAGIPSVLVENFTWDWIYEEYSATHAEILPYVNLLGNLFAQADYHIQAMPVCCPGKSDLLVGPVARLFSRKREEVRRQLGLAETEKVVLVSMGGDSARATYLPKAKSGDVRFLMPGTNKTSHVGQPGQVVFIDRGMYHPDLVAACDAVIGKVGYSTLSEVYHAGVPFGYIGRPRFRESERLIDFIQREMPAMEIAEQELSDGGLDTLLPDLFSIQTSLPRHVNGAYQCAEFLLGLLQESSCRVP